MFGHLTGVKAAFATFTLGACSRAMAMVVFCPVRHPISNPSLHGIPPVAMPRGQITVLKTRAEVRGTSGCQRGLLGALAHLARTEGSAGLFSGLSAALLRDVPYSGLNLLLLRMLLENRLIALLPPASQAAAAGATSASFATLLTQPADVARTQQVLRAQKEKRQGTATVLAQVYRAGGLPALYVGGTARVATRAVQQAITWGVYEAMVGRG
jgi:solute carrier family 25, member 38|uniref:Uncharacterized protein n=1 Tax=Haptolina ericina TaxID=156174 RepID=A0A7S3B4D8_9EUKA|mmetsp:Transcript_50782/g.114217  ORF Transcript_50782/g.114217 Transcript_50782/m.114217 type:complete len:212 (+) Transcript_50782:353-988(+)